MDAFLQLELSVARLRRGFGAGWRGSLGGGYPRAAPFSRAEGSYKTPGSQAQDLTRPGTEARRLFASSVEHREVVLLFLAFFQDLDKLQ